MRLLPLASLGVDGAETQVALRLQRAHAKFLSKGDGLVDVRGLATPGALAEEPADMRLVAMPGVDMGNLEETFGEGAGLSHAADEQTRLAQLGERQRME